MCNRAPLGNALDRTAQQPRRPTKLTLSEFGGIGEAQGNPSYISAWWGWACKATDCVVMLPKILHTLRKQVATPS